jgi:hypothetical protein
MAEKNAPHSVFMACCRRKSNRWMSRVAPPDGDKPQS